MIHASYVEFVNDVRHRFGSTAAGAMAASGPAPAPLARPRRARPALPGRIRHAPRGSRPPRASRKTRAARGKHAARPCSWQAQIPCPRRAADRPIFDAGSATFGSLRARRRARLSR
ncbi:hypothetical protein I6G79_31710 [Burkholderia plantarii]|nr:hypothetical protein [Burkholderia plantarii]